MKSKLLKKAALKTLGCAAAGAGVAASVAACTYATRINTLHTLQQHTFYEDEFNLYSIKVRYDYDLNSVLHSNITDNESFMQAIVKQSAPHVPFKIEAPNFACSAFAWAGGCAEGAGACSGEGAEDAGACSGEGARTATNAADSSSFAFMGRNYDFILDTSALLVECAPRGGYRSLALAALDNVHADTPRANYKKRLACLGAPFICLDGVNEKGVSIAVLTLDSEPVNQQNNKRKITTSLAIRLVLDRAATTADAVELLRSYDMLATSGRDYHFFITDAQGTGCVVEWDPLDPARNMKVTPMRAITNFYAMYKDKVAPNQKNGVYGHGLERYDAIERVLGAAEAGLTSEGAPGENACESAGRSASEGAAEVSSQSSQAARVAESEACDTRAAAEGVAWCALRASSQDPNPADPTSNTQYSAVFDNKNKSVRVCIRRNWDDTFEFSL